MRSVGCDFSSEKVIRRLQWGSRTVILYCSKRVENLYQQQRNLYRKWPRQTIPLINPMMPCNTEPERDIQGLTNDEVKAHKVYNPIRRLLTMSDFQPTTPSSITIKWSEESHENTSPLSIVTPQITLLHAYRGAHVRNPWERSMFLLHEAQSQSVPLTPQTLAYEILRYHMEYQTELEFMQLGLQRELVKWEWKPQTTITNPQWNPAWIITRTGLWEGCSHRIFQGGHQDGNIRLIRSAITLRIVGTLFSSNEAISIPAETSRLARRKSCRVWSGVIWPCWNVCPG